jgi:hypothetical protein
MTTNELDIHMNNIRQGNMNELFWDKHWASFTNWGKIVDKWKKETLSLEKAQIMDYMGVPQVSDFH